MRDPCGESVLGEPCSTDVPRWPSRCHWVTGMVATAWVVVLTDSIDAAYSNLHYGVCYARTSVIVEDDNKTLFC